MIPVATNETLIGELVDIEKALFSTIEILTSKANAIADANNEMVEQANNKGEEVDDLQVLLNKAEHEAIAKMLEGLSAVLWHSIKKRIGAPANEKGAIGIRNGYQLVSFQPQEDESEMFAKLLMRGGRDRGLALVAMLGGIGR